ncbi:MAG: response regulator transcription factor [Alphaproteobacteria bacterium]|jgi:DNA-binding NarL/FixJ family response regulator|nr:response regulator transcription factor [Alphaproteobacteria bacterium]
MKVLIMDEQSLFRDGLSLRLKEINENIIILQSSNLTEMQKILSHETDTDVVILDIDLAGINSTETITKIKNIIPTIKIITTSTSEDIRNIKKILSLGVDGYIPKRSNSNILSGALKLILDGGTYIPPAMLNNGIDYSSFNSSSSLKKNLTNRQSQVLDLIAQGKSNKQIAYDMGVSEATVKLHINALLRSLKVNNRTQAVITAQKMGLI